MTIYYSATTNGFYPDFLIDEYKSYGTLPDDLIEISDRWHEYLLAGQGEGKIIAPNEYGQPVLYESAAPSVEQLIYEAEARKTTLMQAAGDAIAPLQDAVDLDIATSKENSLLLGWKKYRVLLNRIDTSKPQNINWPETPADVA